MHKHRVLQCGVFHDGVGARKFKGFKFKQVYIKKNMQLGILQKENTAGMLQFRSETLENAKPYKRNMSP